MNFDYRRQSKLALRDERLWGLSGRPAWFSIWPMPMTTKGDCLGQQIAEAAERRPFQFRSKHKKLKKVPSSVLELVLCLPLARDEEPRSEQEASTVNPAAAAASIMQHDAVILLRAGVV